MSQAVAPALGALGAGYLAQGMASVGDIKFVVSNATPKHVGVKETNNVQIQKTIDAQYSSNVQGHRSLSGNAQLDNNVSRRVASHSVHIEEEDEEATEGKNRSSSGTVASSSSGHASHTTHDSKDASNRNHRSKGGQFGVGGGIQAQANATAAGSVTARMPTIPEGVPGAVYGGQGAAGASADANINLGTGGHFSVGNHAATSSTEANTSSNHAAGQSQNMQQQQQVANQAQRGSTRAALQAGRDEASSGSTNLAGSMTQGAGHTVNESYTHSVAMRCKAQENYGSPGEVHTVKPGDSKEITAIEVQITIDGQVVGTVKKGAADPPGTVKAYVVIQNLDGQYEVLPAQGDGRDQKWMIRHTDTDETYHDSRVDAAARLWSRSHTGLRRVGAAYIANLCRAGTPAALEDIKYILRKASQDGQCLYTADDFDNGGVRSILRGCQPDKLRQLCQLTAGTDLATEVTFAGILDGSAKGIPSTAVTTGLTEQELHLLKGIEALEGCSWDLGSPWASGFEFTVNMREACAALLKVAALGPTSESVQEEFQSALQLAKATERSYIEIMLVTGLYTRLFPEKQLQIVTNYMDELKTLLQGCDSESGGRQKALNRMSKVCELHTRLTDKLRRELLAAQG